MLLPNVLWSALSGSNAQMGCNHGLQTSSNKVPRSSKFQDLQKLQEKTPRSSKPEASHCLGPLEVHPPTSKRGIQGNPSGQECPTCQKDEPQGQASVQKSVSRFLCVGGGGGRVWPHRSVKLIVDFRFGSSVTLQSTQDRKLLAI